VFFDSGIGGITVLNEAKIMMPLEHYIYFADSDNIPYGTKTSKEIIDMVFDAAEFLDKFNPKALVLACNTATSVVVNRLREKYNYPVIGMEPAVKPASELCSSGKILLCATEKTLEEEKLDNLIKGLNAEDRTEKVSLQNLVLFAERQDFNSPDLFKYLISKLEDIEWKEYSSIVLGCTHFIYYKEQIRSIVPDHIQIVDGNLGTVKHAKELIVENIESANVNDLFFISKKFSSANILNDYMSYLNTNTDYENE